VKIKVRFFASVKEAVGTEAEELDLPEAISTVAGVRAYLNGRGGPWAQALGESRRIRAAVNQEMAAPEARVASGDEVAFFPPVTGG
jgi:sulfur-carrier protein